MKKLIVNVIFLLCLNAISSFGQTTSPARDAYNFFNKFCNITENSSWELTRIVKLKFRSYHPQGMIKVGKFYYLSSVEKIARPKKYQNLQNGNDRSIAKGIGHLFKFNDKGDIVSQVTISDSIIYHPGGIDFDGKFIWVPVAEYRPNSKSIIYRINPSTLEFETAFRFNDHIGAVACDTKNNTLIGVSWGSRRFYFWKLNFDIGFGRFNKKNEYSIPNYEMKLNDNYYIDYQDCHYAGSNCILCGGLKNYSTNAKVRFALGGLDLIEIKSFIPIHQIPVNLFSKSGAVMTRNPFYFELIGDRLMFYFIPEDNESNMYVYEIKN